VVGDEPAEHSDAESESENVGEVARGCLNPRLLYVGVVGDDDLWIRGEGDSLGVEDCEDDHDGDGHNEDSVAGCSFEAWTEAAASAEDGAGAACLSIITVHFGVASEFWAEMIDNVFVFVECVRSVVQGDGLLTVRRQQWR
jgi:hypothetical protein